MSLINKMLSDLEMRTQDLQRNTKPEPVLDGLRAANEDSHRIPKQRRAWWLLVALAAVSFLAWQWYPIVQQRWQAFRVAAKVEVKHAPAAVKELTPTEHAKRESVAVIEAPTNHDPIAPTAQTRVPETVEKAAVKSSMDDVRQADAEEFFAAPDEDTIVVEPVARKKEKSVALTSSNAGTNVIEHTAGPPTSKTQAKVKPNVVTPIDDSSPRKIQSIVDPPIAKPTAPTPMREFSATESRTFVPSAIGAPDEIDVAVLAPPPTKPIMPPSKPRSSDAPPAAHVTKTLDTLSNEQQALQSFNDGMSFWQQGKLRDAEAALRRSLGSDQRQTSARAALTRMLLEQKRWVDAQVVAEEGLQHVSNDKETRQLLARLLIERKEASRAVELLEAGAKQGGASADYYGLLAESYRQIGRAADAASAYRTAINQNPQEGRWWIGLAVALETDSKPKDALQAYERALQTDVLPETLNRFANQRISVLRNAP